MGERGRAVLLDDAKRIEARADRGPLVDAQERAGQLAQPLGPAQLLGRDRAALDEARDEVSLRLEEAHDLGADAQLGCDARGLVLGVPVDAEQLGVLAADPQDEALAVDRDLEVAVRDPAAEHLEHGPRAGPDPLCDRSDVHARDRTGAAASARGGRRERRSGGEDRLARPAQEGGRRRVGCQGHRWLRRRLLGDGPSHAPSGRRRAARPGRRCGRSGPRGRAVLEPAPPCGSTSGRASRRPRSRSEGRNRDR